MRELAIGLRSFALRCEVMSLQQCGGEVRRYFLRPRLPPEVEATRLCESILSTKSKIGVQVNTQF